MEWGRKTSRTWWSRCDCWSLIANAKKRYPTGNWQNALRKPSFHKSSRLFFYLRASLSKTVHENESKLCENLREVKKSLEKMSDTAFSFSHCSALCVTSSSPAKERPMSPITKVFVVFSSSQMPFRNGKRIGISWPLAPDAPVLSWWCARRTALGAYPITS